MIDKKQGFVFFDLLGTQASCLQNIDLIIVCRQDACVPSDAGKMPAILDKENKYLEDLL